MTVEPHSNSAIPNLALTGMEAAKAHGAARLNSCGIISPINNLPVVRICAEVSTNNDANNNNTKK
jgi:hypothetical protein